MMNDNNTSDSERIDPTDLDDDELLDAIETTYREALDENKQIERLTAFNRFHELRYEAAERGLRDEASERTEAVRSERS